jgi:diguanylate cyclase (GGDEF)-like protein/putative nucleotidyltransferase with HDIG domain
MRRFFPRDVLLVARLVAVAGALVWILIGGQAALPLAYVALAFLIATSALVWRDDVRRLGAPVPLSETPAFVVIGDLCAASVWMVASAPNERSVAFVVVVAIGALAMYRLGKHGVTATAAAYLVGRIGQEIVRVVLGIPTPIAQVFGEAMVVILVLIILSATVAHYRGEQRSGARALRLARSLQRVATEIGQETASEALFRSIARNALLLVDAHHATINRRRGDEFAIVAGAGTGERAVGVRASARLGIVGAVLRSRQAVAWADYAADPTAVPEIKDIGVRSIVGVPIVVQGEIAATLTVGRLAVRPFDLNDIHALEGLAAHAAIALRNARILEQARRVETVSRELAAETGATSDVIRRIAQEMHGAYDTEFVMVTELRGETAVDVAGVGFATPLTAPQEVGPLVQRVIRRREVVSLRDYSIDTYGESSGRAEFLREVGIHAAMAAPVMLGGEVVGSVGIATTDPDRTFDAIDRQGLFAFAQLAAAAMRSARVRAEREQRIRRLSALNELAWQLAGVHEPFGIARLAYEAAGALVARDSFYVARYDAGKKEFEFVLQAEGTDSWVGERHPLGTGPTSQVVLTGDTYLVKGVGDPVQRQGMPFGETERPSASAVHVPLKSRGRLVGVLSSQAYRPGAYDAEDIAVLQSLGNLVATAFENAEHLAQMRELYLASVKALAAAVDARDPYTRSHSARVAALARTIADEMRMSADQLRRVQLGALLHDIGKIGVPDAILNKPGPLTADEWVLMRTHPAVGGSILAAVEPLRDLVPIVKAHHERFDGAGYPDKLAGDSVPLEAYVVAAADAFEVIVSRRAYKQAQSVEFACAELVRCRGTQFHPDVVDAFLRVIDRDRLQGAAYLRRVGAIEEEDMENVPGPGGVLEQFAASAHAHGRQLAILQRLASEISAVLDIDTLAQRLLRIVCESMGYENGFLLTLDDKHESLVVRAAVGPSEPYVGQLLTKGVGISWWVIEHGQLQNVTDAQSDARFYGPPNIESVLVVPLQLGEERVGALGIESPRSEAFGREDEELLTAVSHQVAAALRVAKLHQAAKTAAATDPLTGLPNRRTFFTRLGTELEGDPLIPVTVAVLDVNGLKQLNDQFGHGAGDEALIRIGEMLSAGVRDGDTVARIGGDEFAILFPGAPLFAAERVMRRVAGNIAEGTLADGKRLPTIAWGVADASDRPISVDALVDAADRAMYRHKQLTRGSRASTA